MSARPDYDSLSGRLRGLLIALMDVLTPSELSEVDEFLDHAEFGEALRSLAWIISEEAKTISASHFAEIQQLALDMRMAAELPPDLVNNVEGSEPGGGDPL
ncbi:MafI family immunity protein [Knoellia locipacati]|uniref:MafI family immunity protein n=1 Tax=Knoellia locipacati TaxID=882824 RepID=UPI00384A7F0A